MPRPTTPHHPATPSAGPAFHGRRSKLRHHTPAFTLAELLVVIAIIGVLIAFLVPAISKVKRASQGAATQAQMAAIATAIQSYYSDFRAYPGPFPNNELGGKFYTANPTTVSPAGFPLDYVKGVDSTGAPDSFGPFDTTQAQQVTGSENLVLGLLGGLELEKGALPVCYDPYAIWPPAPSGSMTPVAAPAPKGAMNLNAANPKRFASYLQVKLGDLTPPSNLSYDARFTDAALRGCQDSIIPEFLDKFSQPMPILYLRANPGAPGIATNGGIDPFVAGSNLMYQYDLAQILGYTAGSNGTAIGTTANNPALDHHGLQGLSLNFVNDSTTPKTFYPLVGNPGEGKGSTYGANFAGSNALLYLRDPNTPTVQPDGSTDMDNYHASPRQKDGFILISPGPDGVYGTADDLIYPGSLNP